MTRVSAAIRQQVRARANSRCEYCREPDSISLQSFHIEHILSIKHGGTSSLDNLAWSCFDCNIFKGTDIAARDPLTGNLVPLFHPRQQVWAENFALDGAWIVGKTPVGRATVALLQINRSRAIEIRQELINARLW